PEQLQQFYSELQASRSSATVLKVHRMLHSAFKLAVRWEAMPHNVAELVLAPPTGQRHEFTTFTAEQVRSFLKAVRGDRLEALYVLAVTTGMRRGELPRPRWGGGGVGGGRPAAAGCPAIKSPASHAGRWCCRGWP